MLRWKLFLFGGHSGPQLGKSWAAAPLYRIFERMNHPRSVIWGACTSLLLLISTPQFSIAQQSEDVHASGSNILRVGSGSTSDISNKESTKKYFEEIANARLFFQYFSIGLRYEMDDPSEVGHSYSDKAFRRRWITYRKDQLELQAGDVSALFGRGLALNSFESRAINYDSWLDGVFGKTELKIPKDLVEDMTLGLKGIGGITDFYPVSAGATDTSQIPTHISARAVNGELTFFKRKLTLGAVFVEANTSLGLPDILSSTTTTARSVNEPDFYVDLNAGEFEAFAEWTENRTHATISNPLLNLNTDTSHTGHAVYGSLSYSNSIFGITTEYKNYQYYRHSNQDAYVPAFGKLPLSNPPEVYKDFVYNSITRTTHATNFDDEVGLQTEVNITAIDHVTIDLYGAASSRHEKYNGSTAVDSLSIFPKIGDAGFYPFWEAFAEVEWNFNPENEIDYFRLAAHRRFDIIAYFPSAIDYQYSTTLAAKVQYETTPTQSLLGILEHQWAYDYSRPDGDHRVLNEMLTLQYSFNPIVTFGGIIDLRVQYENAPYHIDDTWGQVFASTRLGGSHTMLVSYGAERGGINCTGGICRFVPPFKGFRFTLTSQI
jgi:hypothetical protein